MAAISVIVPVYKVEDYIRRCINSILAQSFTDFDLILIDDGSPDKCSEICDSYAKRDTRIHVIHQSNSGLSAARNTGIDWSLANSDSQWLTFIDSDDFVHENMLEMLYQAVIENKTDVSVCRYREVNDLNERYISLEKYSSFICSPEEFFVSDNVNATVAWGKLYKKKLFESVRYPIGKLHEDEFVTYRVLFQLCKISVVNNQLYYYYQNNGGIMRSSWSPSKLVGLEAKKEQILYFSQHNFYKARIRSIKALLWMTKDHLDIVTELRQKKYIKDLRIELRRSIHEYKDDISLSPDNTSDLFESAYPNLMKVYWIWRACVKKIFK